MVRGEMPRRVNGGVRTLPRPNETLAFLRYSFSGGCRVAAQRSGLMPLVESCPLPSRGLRAVARLKTCHKHA